MDTNVRLSLALLGRFEVTFDGHPVTTFESIKVRALLAYLAVEGGRRCARAFLAELLWPDLPAATALTYLRHVLAKLKEAIPDRTPGAEGSLPAGPPFLLITRETVALNPAADVALDVAAFTALLESCASHAHRHAETCASCARRRAAAVALYQGDFLSHFLLGDSAAFEEWAALIRERLRQQALDALTRLARYHERRGTYQDAQRYAWRQVELDPWREEAYQQLMRALWLSGQPSAALEQYARCRRILREELGVEPSATTTVLYERIRGTEPCALSEVFPLHRPDNLPAQATPLIGREAELARLADLLEQPARRLITLTGPGGIGKTRLALEAAELDDDFPDGVCFVALAPVADPALVIPAIAHALGVQESSGQPLLESVKVHLRDRQLLLLLDNFEHIGAAASCVAALLGAAPGLAVLVTSRVVLRLYGEHEFPVPPLSVPKIEHVRSLPDLCRSEAVRLFAERAQAVHPDFALTGESAPVVAEICRRLDGLPLAIELAAARIRLLTPQTMLYRLGSPLALLTGGARDLPARHQTLRATIDWSYDLLPAGEQQLLARLAVFVGGWTLEAAEAICGSVSTLPCGTLDGIEALATKSLVRQTEAVDGEPRFTMLETIHEYARERLAASGEAEAVQGRHGAYFLALAEQAEPELAGPHQVEWLDRLEAEHDNLRAALRGALERNEVEMALRLGGALSLFWSTHGHLSEGRRWLATVLGRAALAVGVLDGAAERARAAAQSKGLKGAGFLAFDQGDNGAARGFYEESLAISRELGDKHGSVFSLVGLGGVAVNQGDYGAARGFYEESLAISRELGDKHGSVFSLVGLGIVADNQGDYGAARAFLQESLAIGRELGDKSGTALSLMFLGVVVGNQGDYGAARAFSEESLAIWRELGDKQGSAYSLNNLGVMALYEHDDARARAHFHESLAVLHSLGNTVGMAWCLGGLAGVAGAQHHPTRAARLWGMADALRTDTEVAIPEVDRARFERMQAAARAQLDGAAWTTAWAEGQAMTLEQAIAYALGDET